jgi:hypothetical protein
MILWLASYPRSGDTLVRAILERRFGFKSGERTSASSSTDPVLVRTHLPPEDGRPAVYVVRNGRQATLSYFHHLRRPASRRQEPNLLELVLGYDLHGDWSGHYRDWNPEVRPDTLVLRFERLIAQPEEEISRIAHFLAARDYTCRGPACGGPPCFRRGEVRWAPDASWSPEIEEVFDMRHGALMRELGYVPLDPAADFAPTDSASRAAFFRDLDAFARRARAARDSTETAAKLRAIAQERLELLGNLDIAAQERLRELSELRREVEVRDDAIAALRLAAEGTRVFEAAAHRRMAEVETLTEALREMERVAGERLRVILRLEGDLLRKDRFLRFLQRCFRSAPRRVVP